MTTALAFTFIGLSIGASVFVIIEIARLRAIVDELLEGLLAAEIRLAFQDDDQLDERIRKAGV